MSRSARRIQNEEGAVVRKEVARAAWSPAQVIALIAGLVLVVMGAVGLAHTGARFSDIALTRSSVAGLPITSLSALAELIVGVIVLVGAASPTVAKAVTSVLGVVLLAWGLIVAFDSTPFYRLWGYDRADGIFYVVVGAVLLVTAAVSPIFTSRRDVIVRDSASTAESNSMVV